ncbi:MAG: hypothetical protein AUJ51_04840 [Elusimicrobia bacterium CG1_02_56_21]|nr:MAG: hypothetical protein AUJ51_04840 [Elusimicrobia bacterium CG1_02_56_21]
MKRNNYFHPAAAACIAAGYNLWVQMLGRIPEKVWRWAGKRSVDLVRKKFAAVAILRRGYFCLCWITGIAIYIGTILFFVYFPDLVDFKAPVERSIFKFYFWAGVQLVVLVGVIMLFLRPVYIISACDIYAERSPARRKSAAPLPPPGARGYGAVAVFRE